jgi:hypothetical protein
LPPMPRVFIGLSSPGAARHRARNHRGNGSCL